MGLNAENKELWLPIIDAFRIGVPMESFNGVDWNSCNEIDFEIDPRNYRTKPLARETPPEDGFCEPDKDVRGDGELKVQMIGWWFPVFIMPRIRVRNITEAERLVAFLSSIDHTTEASRVRRHIKDQTDGLYLNKDAYQGKGDYSIK